MISIFSHYGMLMISWYVNVHITKYVEIVKYTTYNGNATYLQVLMTCLLICNILMIVDIL